MRTIHVWRLGMWRYPERQSAAAEAGIDLPRGAATSVELESSDPRSARLREVLLRRGAKEGASEGFHLRVLRRFDPEEIDAAPYLWYQPHYANEAFRPILADGGKHRTENGDLILDPRWGEDEHGMWQRRLINVWHAKTDGFILRRAVLNAFDPAKFAPVEMRPVFLEGEDRPIAEMMEVRPVIELPPLAPGTFVRMPYPGRNEPVGDPGPGALCQEGFEDFIPFYRREEFEAIGPFHFARTREFQYLTDPDARRAVVSQEFRKFIDANAGPADISWVPVMLVD
jgi:hypothetical protein